MVYFDHQKTLYCDATFNSKKEVVLPLGFSTDKYKKRAQRIEFEHIVSAENMGRAFPSWREGHTRCNKNGKAYKGRKCALLVSKEFRLMAADLYNLSPAIGSVNAQRSNYRYAMLPNTPSNFGSCAMKIDSRKAEPPAEARGRIARAQLYMDMTYPRFSLSRSQKQLMEAWNRQFPISHWECIRAGRIKEIQNNVNPLYSTKCHY